ncbi:prepilin peptidase [Paracidovorax citrulli]
MEASLLIACGGAAMVGVVVGRLMESGVAALVAHLDLPDGDAMEVHPELLHSERAGECAPPVVHPRRGLFLSFAYAALAAGAAYQFGTTGTTVVVVVLLWGLLTLALVDLDTQLLPDCITQPMLWAGLLASTAPFGLSFVPVEDAVIGAACGYLSLWLPSSVYKALRAKEGMGQGDFKLMAVLGAWLGWQSVPAMVMIASTVALLYTVASCRRANFDREATFPFGPFLVGAGMTIVFFGRYLSPFVVRV